MTTDRNRKCVREVYRALFSEDGTMGSDPDAAFSEDGTSRRVWVNGLGQWCAEEGARIVVCDDPPDLVATWIDASNGMLATYLRLGFNLAIALAEDAHAAKIAEMQAEIDRSWDVANDR